MEYKHFSHKHNLTLSTAEEGQRHQCHGCQTLCNPPSTFFACRKCNFFLHEHCGNANRFLKHPAHPQHPIILLPKPTYCSGAFNCNACGVTGNSFSYSCALCEVDLHVNCAFLPIRVTHKDHEHGLVLTVPSPLSNYAHEIPKTSCKSCNQELSPKLWEYSCRETDCDFRIHTFCGTTEVKPGQFIDDEPEATDQAARSEPSEPEAETNETETETNETETEMTMQDKLNRMEMLQFQMKLSAQFAQMNSSYNFCLN